MYPSPPLTFLPFLHNIIRRSSHLMSTAHRFGGRRCRITMPITTNTSPSHPSSLSTSTPQAMLSPKDFITSHSLADLPRKNGVLKLRPSIGKSHSTI